MNKYWLKIAQKIDSYSLRERIIMTAMGALGLWMLMNFLVFDPLALKSKKLTGQMQQEQEQIATLTVEQQQIVQQHAFDPDAANRARLQELAQQLRQIHTTLTDLQKGLVPPNRMATLLEDILQRNGKLRVVTLHTLAPVNLIGAKMVDGDASKTSASVASATGATAANATVKKSALPSTTAAIYKHGVEITLQGNYLDMLHYMSELEAMPWQLYWGNAKLDVNEERPPVATLTLTLFTLSLDKKWLNL